jgi:general secretion pathway protein D
MGDLPVVGALFRNEQRSRKKTNLMVFLRPIVIRDDATSDALVQDRYEAIRALQMGTQPADSTMMRAVNQAPVLPPIDTQSSPSKNGNAPKKQVPPSLIPVEVERQKSSTRQPADASVQDPNFTPQ